MPRRVHNFIDVRCARKVVAFCADGCVFFHAIYRISPLLRVLVVYLLEIITVQNNMPKRPLPEEPTPSKPVCSLRHLESHERVYDDQNSMLMGNIDFHFVTGIMRDIKDRAKQKSRRSGKDKELERQKQKKKEEAEAKEKALTSYSRYDQEMYEDDDAMEFNINQSLSFEASANGTLESIPLEVQSTRLGRVKSRTPIIIVPASTASLITLLNARDILQDMNFIKHEDKKGEKRPTEVLVLRSKEDKPSARFRVIDNPMKLSGDDWDRVVAVFAQGAAWQFKGWRWNGNPTDIFSNVAAFHLKYEGDRTDANIEMWNVTVISIPKTKRHLDKANFGKFWQILERHMQKNKPHLRF
uniref:CDC73_C domain-containing protein n=1 Tax=Steinernema glaseri TaxID=37863 RepID=A0A1I7YSV7_9BILA